MNTIDSHSYLGVLLGSYTGVQGTLEPGAAAAAALGPLCQTRLSTG